MGSYESPSRAEMSRIFNLCQTNKWQKVTEAVLANHATAISPIVMGNHITTTILHQAITSKAKVEVRAELIETILNITPAAAAIKNGYGSLPLHVICQRNTKMKAKIKERIIFKLIKAHVGALLEIGGVGQRTPLHIIFTGEYMLLYCSGTHVHALILGF